MKKADRISGFVKELGQHGDFAAADFDPRYVGYFTCFNRGDYYEAHDVLEDLWLQTTGEDYGFYKGLIQIAGAFVHLRKQRERPNHAKDGRRLHPATRLFALGVGNLRPFSPLRHRLDVGSLIRFCEKTASEIRDSDFQANPWRPEALPQLALETRE